MRSVHRQLLLQTVLIASSSLAPQALLASDVSLDFLKAARERQYGEVSVDYLNQLKDSGKLPPDLTEVWDLKMSEALRMSVREAFNAKEREERQVKSKEFLDKFLKEHSEHPEVSHAQSAAGELAIDRGLAQMRYARSTKDKEAAAKAMAEARKAFEDAKPRFAEASKRYRTRFEDLQGELDNVVPARKKKLEAQTEEALFDWLEGRFQAGVTDFYLAQTIEDVKNKDRIAVLTEATKIFDAIFQDNRESLIGLTAHAWHGRCADELGSADDAADIYDEVLSNVDDPKKETGLEGMFSQVFYFRTLMEVKKSKPSDVIGTLAGWRKEFKPWRQHDGYQGISHEYVKLLLARAEKESPDQKRKTLLDVNAVLKDMIAVPSEYRDDAVTLARSIKKDTGDSEPGSLVEAIAMGDSAVSDNDWAAADKYFTKALEMAKKSTKTNEKKQVADIEARLEQTQYRHAVALYGEAKFEEALAICGEVAKNKDSAIGPASGGLAVSCALTLYSQAPDAAAKEKALERLNKIAQYVIETWPDKAEADDTRIAMGQAKLVQGKWDDAIQVFDAVNPRSERYGVGLFLSGQTHWRLYQGERKANPEKAKERAKTAEERLTAAVEALRKVAADLAKKKPPEPAPHSLAEAELLLGEVLIETDNGPRAVELVAPQVAAILSANPKPQVDNVVLRTFLAGVRAYLAAGDYAKASEAALALVEMAPDQPQVNKVLFNIAYIVQGQWKETSAAAIRAKTDGDTTAQEAADAKAKALAETLGKYMEKMIAKKHTLDTKSEMFLAQTAMDIQRPDIAEPIYTSLTEKMDNNDPSIPPAAKPKLRTSLTSILRNKGDYDAALKQVDKIITEFPNALDPMMERGRILQTWAETDDSKFAEAVTTWTALRQRLHPMRQKPSEYYDVILYSAECLLKEGEKKNDPSKKIETAKLLNAILVLNPKLNGPTTVARYEELLKKADPVGFKKKQEMKKLREREEKAQAKAAAAAK